MDYLIYVSHDAENLQFWLWLQAYSQRFYAAPRSEQALSPLWFETEASQPDGNAVDPSPRTADTSNVDVSDYETKFDHAESPVSPVSSAQFDKQSYVSGIASSNKTVTDSVDDANAQSGLRWQGCGYHVVSIENLR